MIALFLLVLFGLGMAYFSTQNTSLVHMAFGGYVINGIPLYIIVICALLLGIFMSFLISLADSFTNILRFHGKESELKSANKRIDELKRENHDLEMENMKLKNETHTVEHKEEVTQEKPMPRSDLRPSLFNFRQHFG